MVSVPAAADAETTPLIAVSQPERLLIPIGRSTQPAAMVRYVRDCAARGQQVEACLLHVDEARGPWELMNPFRGGGVSTRWLAKPVLEQVARDLTQSGIPNAAYLRSDSIVFAILDVAEELDCTGIVVPMPGSGWRRIFSRGIVAILHARKRNIPIITVAADGSPVAGELR